MRNELKKERRASRLLKAGVSIMFAAVLSACANYAGIHRDAKTAGPQQYATQQSIPAQQGHWPAADWPDRFGDAQLKALIAEALRSSPTLDQGRSRVSAAAAYREPAKPGTMPRVDASYSLTRPQFSARGRAPPPYGGSWQPENKCLLSASCGLALWGKNRKALKAGLSQLQASQA